MNPDDMNDRVDGESVSLFSCKPAIIENGRLRLLTEEEFINMRYGFDTEEIIVFLNLPWAKH